MWSMYRYLGKEIAHNLSYMYTLTDRIRNYIYRRILEMKLNVGYRLPKRFEVIVVI